MIAAGLAASLGDGFMLMVVLAAAAWGEHPMEVMGNR